jgi:cytochrome c oxidase subunit 2
MMDDESRDDGAVEVDAAMPVPGSDAVEMVASRVITVDTSSWAFSPNAITVKKGESVTLQFSGKSGTHGVSIPKLNVQSDAFSAGNTVSLELPTDTAGTFEFKCKVPCGEGHKDMKGTILIEE